MMSRTQDQSLLDALLDSWDRNNTILLNLLRALPEGGLEARVMEGSPSVAELFTHTHFVRLVFIYEDATEFARDLPVCALRGQEPGGSRPGHEPPLRPPDPPTSAHALARRLSPRPDQTGPQSDGPPRDG